jgi:hypothetical protein
VRFRELVESVSFDGLTMSAQGFTHEIDPEVLARLAEILLEQIGTEKAVRRVHSIKVAELVTIGLNYDANGFDSFRIDFVPEGTVINLRQKRNASQTGEYREDYTHEIAPHRMGVRVSEYLMAVHPGITVDMYVGEISQMDAFGSYKRILAMNPNLREDLRLLLEIK